MVVELSPPILCSTVQVRLSRLALALAVTCALVGGAGAAVCPVGVGNCCAIDADCDDGDACTGIESCDASSGTCVAGTAVDCSDGNPCTDDLCDPLTGTCSNPPSADGTSCEDGDACTAGDACVMGSCVPGAPVVCGVFDQCHEAGTCDPATGDCLYPPVPDATPCDDGDACTVGDACMVGGCVPGVPVVCAALDQCHDAGTCDPATGLCSNPVVADATPCEDGDACTVGDACVAGSCVPGVPVVCSAPDQCHDAGTCNPTTGVCSDPAKPNGTTCDDGNACTIADTCEGGLCTPGAPVVCAAQDQCHDAGTCDPATGTCSNPAKPDGAVCDDGNACTTVDMCDGGACIGGKPVVCDVPDQCHDAGTCNPATGTCSNPAKANGTTCDDGNACTTADTCEGGTCVAGTPVVCHAQDQCHNVGTCDPASGTCSNPAKPNGTTCDDGNACTTADTCEGGVCAAGAPVLCAPQDQCHDAGTCNPATGSCSNPAKLDGAVCDDGNGCTTVDMCEGGTCLGTKPVVCTAQDQCHDAGTCNPATGVCSNPAKANGTTCDDGNACTTADTCADGTCTAGTPVVCTAQDQCHDVGTCNPATGVCSNPAKPNGTTCDDGNACTTVDTCEGGTCIAGTAVVCHAQDQCHDAGTCNPATGTCSNPAKANGTTCDDGNACTRTDTCQAGTCTGANPVTCAVPDQCHDAGTCNPATGICSNPAKPNGTTCDDGNACTRSDSCQTGTCTGGNPVTCTAQDQCHDVGTCNTATGVCSTPAKPDGTSCNDANACTQTDTCQAGACTGTNPVVCSAQDQCHDAGTCNPSTGVCSNPAKPNGAACDDHDACTRSDTCQAGTCTGTNPVACKALDQCHAVGTCDPTSGACSNPARPDGTTCDDGNACTTADHCQTGTCSGTAVVCAAPDQCHDPGTCDPGTGICSNPPSADGRTCNDGNACTSGDRCVAGSCAGTPIDCDDGLSCTDDACAQGVCQHVPVDARCDTGACAFGACRPGDPGADRTGCVEAPVNEGEACTDDGFSCTDDVCTGGRCLHVPIDARCVPPDDCTAAVCAPARTTHDAAGCSPGPSRADGEECAEDGEPCTDDLCFGGRCMHEPVPSQTTCEPVTDAFRWTLALQGLARGLSADIAQYPDGAGMTGRTRDLLLARIATVQGDFDTAARGLAGKSGDPSNGGSHQANPTETPAQERARVVTGMLPRMDRDLKLLLRTVPGNSRAPLTRIFYSDLRRRVRLLMRGSKTLRSELKRLQQETHSFAR